MQTINFDKNYIILVYMKTCKYIIPITLQENTALYANAHNLCLIYYNTYYFYKKISLQIVAPPVAEW